MVHIIIFLIDLFFAGGELYAKVSSKEKARLDEDEARTYFAQIIDAIEHLVSVSVGLLLLVNKQLEIVKIFLIFC